MEIKTYTNFGARGALVTMDVNIIQSDLPGIDIVGLSENQTSWSRHILRQATINSNLQLPPDRMIIAFRPCDLLKVDVGQDLAVALAVQVKLHQQKYPDEQKVFVMGTLMPNGRVVERQGMKEGVLSAIEDGITSFIVPSSFQFDFPDGCKVLRVDSLDQTVKQVKDLVSYELFSPKEKNTEEQVKFNDTFFSIDESLVKRHSDIVKAIEVAVAGKHNLLLTGNPSYCNSQIIEQLVPALTPLMTVEEQGIVNRIESIAELDPKEKANGGTAPFRRVHPIVSLDEMIGGGYDCKPGEVSLAHNGTLFLDQAHEFRTSCLQSLVDPLEKGKIMLLKDGRSCLYPSSFQLIMTMPPSPDENYLVEGMVSLSSKKSVSLLWRKVSIPLLDRIEMKNFMDIENNTRYDPNELTLDKMRQRIARAYEIQRNRGTYNSRLNAIEADCCNMDKSANEMLDNLKGFSLTENEARNLVKVSMTIANMDGRQQICKQDLAEAMELTMNSKMRQLLMPVTEPFTHRVENKFYYKLAKQIQLYPDQSILRSAARIINNFDKDEQNIIKQFLKDYCVKDNETLAKTLEKGLIDARKRQAELPKVKSRRAKNYDRER